MMKKHGPGGCCCDTDCILQSTTFDTSGDLATYFDAPGIGVTHDLTNGIVVVDADDIVVLANAEHPTSPYSGRIACRVKIADGKKAKFFLSAADEDNCIVVELEPYTSTGTPCEQGYGWVRVYRKSGGVETLVGHEYLRAGVTADEWHLVSIWWDGTKKRVTVRVDNSDSTTIGNKVTQWFSTWITNGTKAGFGTGTASVGSTVEFDDFVFAALGTINDGYYGGYYENERDCGTAPYSCDIVPAEEMLLPGSTMPCSWDGTPGADWAEYSGTHRTVFGDTNVKVRAVFAFGGLDGEGDSTTVGITGGANTLTATLTETAPDFFGNRLFELVWKFNGSTIRTVSDLGVLEVSGVDITACPTVFVLSNGEYFSADYPGSVLGDPIGVTISQGALGGTQLTAFEIRHHPAGLSDSSECEGCGTCRDLCDPAFEQDSVFVDLGETFLTEQSVFIPWWDTDYNMCAAAEGVLELDVDQDTCIFLYTEQFGSPDESLVIEARFYEFSGVLRWEVTITLGNNTFFVGIYGDTIATYLVEVDTCEVPSEGYWTVPFVSVSNPGVPGSVRCTGDWPDSIKLAFNPGVL